MEQEPRKELPIPATRVSLGKMMGKPLFRFLAFVVCLAILVAAFAVSGIWSSRGEAVETFFAGLFRRDRKTDLPSAEPSPEAPDRDEPTTEPEPFDQPRPDGAISVSSVTVKGGERDPEGVQATDWRLLLNADGATVLVICTDPRETYLEAGTEQIAVPIGDLTYSNDPTRSIAAVAEAFRAALCENGVEAILALPEPGNSLQGSYARAAVTVSEALARNPGIRYVVEIGRDFPTDRNGNYIRAITAGTDEPTAQILAVVGSDPEGDGYPTQAENLAFAESFGQALNQAIPTAFRGIAVRTSPRNQNLAPRWLSLRVGTGCNSLSEAIRSAGAAGKVLAELLRNE